MLLECLMCERGNASADRDFGKDRELFQDEIALSKYRILRGEQMPRIKLKAPRVSRSEQLRTRAANCKALAIAVGDLPFALKLYALADEYDDEAALVDANANINNACPSVRPQSSDQAQLPAHS